MTYFIIHSGADLNVVSKIIDQLRNKAPQNEYDIITERVEEWRELAKSKIINADRILFFVNSDTHEKTNIEYELNCAIENDKKIFIYKLSRKCKISYKMASMLSCNLELRKVGSAKLRIYYRVAKLLKDLNAVDNTIVDHIELFNENVDNEDQFLQQYMMFVKTSEDLVKRKQSLNNLYITLNSAILGIIATITAWKVNNILLPLTSNFSISLKSAAIIGVAVFGMLICFSWKRILKIYDNLNSSKMSVITDIEKNLPLNLFSKEWQCVVDIDAKRRYRSFSKSERGTALIFLVFYLAIVLVVLYRIVSFGS